MCRVALFIVEGRYKESVDVPLSLVGTRSNCLHTLECRAQLSSIPRCDTAEGGRKMSAGYICHPKKAIARNVFLFAPFDAPSMAGAKQSSGSESGLQSGSQSGLQSGPESGVAVGLQVSATYCDRSAMNVSDAAMKMQYERITFNITLHYQC